MSSVGEYHSICNCNNFLEEVVQYVTDIFKAELHRFYTSKCVSSCWGVLNLVLSLLLRELFEVC